MKCESLFHFSVFKCWVGGIYASRASSHLVQVRCWCLATEASTEPKDGQRGRERQMDREKEGERERLAVCKFGVVDDCCCPFLTHPWLPASGAFVMSPGWTLTLPPPTGSSFLLEVRQLQQLSTGQAERRVHHQA